MALNRHAAVALEYLGFVRDVDFYVEERVKTGEVTLVWLSAAVQPDEATINANVVPGLRVQRQSDVNEVATIKARAIVNQDKLLRCILDVLGMLYKMAGGNATALATLTAAERSRLTTYNNWVQRQADLQIAQNTKEAEVAALGTQAAVEAYDLASGWPE